MSGSLTFGAATVGQPALNAQACAERHGNATTDLAPKQLHEGELRSRKGRFKYEKVKALFPEVGEWVLAQGLSVSAAPADHLSSRSGGKVIATSSRRPN